MKPSAREISVEGFDAWLAATDREEAVAKAADEEGGPRLSLVPPTDRDIAWPTDLLPPAGESAPRRSPRRAAGRGHAVRRRPAGGQPQAPRRLERGASAPFPDLPRRNRIGSSCQQRRVAVGAVGLPASRPLAGLRRGLGHGAAACGRAALRARLRPRHQRPGRAGLAGRRARRGETGAERQAAHVAAGPSRPPPLRRPVGAAQGRRRRSSGPGAAVFPRLARRPDRCPIMSRRAQVTERAAIGGSAQSRRMSDGVRLGLVQGDTTDVTRFTRVTAPDAPPMASATIETIRDARRGLFLEMPLTPTAPPPRTAHCRPCPAA